MNSSGARDSSHSCNAAFHIGWRGLHQIGQLIDDEYDVGELIGDNEFALARNANCSCRRLGGRIVFPAARDGGSYIIQFLLRFLRGPSVETGNVSHADARKNLVTPIDFLADP